MREVGRLSRLRTNLFWWRPMRYVDFFMRVRVNDVCVKRSSFSMICRRFCISSGFVRCFPLQVSPSAYSCFPPCSVQKDGSLRSVYKWISLISARRDFLNAFELFLCLFPHYSMPKRRNRTRLIVVCASLVRISVLAIF